MNSIKAHIFQLLQQSTSPVSGEYLSGQLGISRVAVWKHIQHMVAAGCVIHSGPKGYRLSAQPDIMAPWIFGRRADRVHHFPQLPSTMEPAAKLAVEGCAPFSVVVADIQIRGRGRLDHQWASEPGGLYFTMVLRPDLEPRLAPLVNLAAAVDLVKTLVQLYDLKAQVKWPNDVLVDEGKIAGILGQMAIEADRVQYICLGMGINVNNNPRHIAQPVTSVARLTGKPASRSAILTRFWDIFEQRLQSEGCDRVVAQWRRRAATLGRQVVINTPTETIRGTARDLDEEGGLVLALPDGELRTVNYGDCRHPQSSASA